MRLGDALGNGAAVGKTPRTCWNGTLASVQPRIRLTRSFDERHHSYLGYVLGVSGRLGEEERELLVAIGKGAQAKHTFRASDEVPGQSVPVADIDVACQPWAQRALS